MQTLTVSPDLTIAVFVEGRSLAARLSPSQAFTAAEQLVRAGIRAAMAEEATAAARDDASHKSLPTQ